ncbi:uncharacterized protein L3040_007836 [Drepanopeziza brunnea f. sp. 'multigermtubi']|uniref:uncharacterized protein n=1 Tax=Drepanopeziza brunnea f. sp. 'multigermtubi' TaxID=698441 RepID=UPI002392D0BD|nr:hypothetical protein L3040_007836 [Drepanopeziza brunnea f. sp. 'multigermtubi']
MPQMLLCYRVRRLRGTQFFRPQETTSTSSVAPSITAAAVDCDAQANECHTVPGAKKAVCSAPYALLLGLRPYNGQIQDSYYGHHTTSTSSHRTTSTSSAAPSITAPCSAHLSCLSFNPETSSPSTSTSITTPSNPSTITTTSAGPVLYTGAASISATAYGILALAYGAAALW